MRHNASKNMTKSAINRFFSLQRFIKQIIKSCVSACYRSVFIVTTGMYVGTYRAKNKRAIKNRTKQLASRYSRKVRSTT